MCRWKGQGLAASSQEQSGDPDRARGSPGLLLHSRGRWRGLQCGAGGEGPGDEVDLAHVVPFKGGDTEWVSDVVFKTDQEPALVELMKQICALRPSSRSCLTHSGVGDSEGNGLAERAVQSLEEMIRVHKLSFESRLKTKLPCAHPLMARLVEHCADVLNRYNIGVDGRTPYQRLKGRKFVVHMLEFGTSVMFRVSGKVHGGVMQERWFPEIWLGKKLHSEEHLVMKEDGLVVSLRAVRENSQPLVMEDYV